MTRFGSDVIPYVFFSGIDLAQFLSEFSMAREVSSEETHGYGDSWVENSVAFINQFTFSASGWYTLGETDTAFNSTEGTSKVFVTAFEGDAIGSPFIGLQGPILKSYTRETPLGELIKFSTDWVSNGKMDDGVILTTHSAKTSSSNGTSVDQTAGTTAGGAGYLQVSAYSGLTNIIVKIQHSTNNSVWTDLITFTTVTSAPTAERVDVSGTVNRYVRALWTVSGTGSCTFMAGFARY